MKILTPKTVGMKLQINSYRTPQEVKEMFYEESFVYDAGIIDYWQQPESRRYTVDLEVKVVFKSIKEFFNFIEKLNDE